MLNSDGGLIREGEEFLQFSEDGGMGAKWKSSSTRSWSSCN